LSYFFSFKVFHRSMPKSLIEICTLAIHNFKFSTKITKKLFVSTQRQNFSKIFEKRSWPIAILIFTSMRSCVHQSLFLSSFVELVELYRNICLTCSKSSQMGSFNPKQLLPSVKLGIKQLSFNYSAYPRSILLLFF
jgi:hypothetical protein